MDPDLYTPILFKYLGGLWTHFVITKLGRLPIVLLESEYPLGFKLKNNQTIQLSC